MKHKTRTKALSWLLSLAMALSLLPGLGGTARATGSVAYLDDSGSSQTCETYTVVTDSDSAVDWSTGWYVVNGSVTITHKVTCTGDVDLILVDGAALTVSKGISVAEGKGLTIYGQSEGTGTLTATGGDYAAGIGGSAGGGGGTITINGGKVTATGANNGAGIGGGVSGGGGTITINGGTVTATGGAQAAGIGGGNGGSGGAITINGGEVKANGCAIEGNNDRAGAGIGNGEGSSGGTITINGGSVEATGGVNSDNAGNNGKGIDGTLNLGTGVKLETSSDGSDWADTTVTPATRTQYMKATYTPPHAHNGITFTAWTSTDSLPTTSEDAHNIYLTRDVTLTSTWTVPTDAAVNLCLNGHGIMYTGNGESVITVGSGATLNLFDCDTTTEHYITLTNGRGTEVSSSGTPSNTCIKVTGGYITGGNKQSYESGKCGGGVSVNGGAFTMSGGTIVGNVGYNGGGVFIYGKSDARGAFTMSGGSITGNKAGGGGGVYVFNENTSFTMRDGSISKNVSSSDGGGVRNSGTFTMSGGSITGNTTDTFGSGGGVRNSGTFTMSGGSITGNTTNYTSDSVNKWLGGGGVHSTGTFELSGAVTITGNKWKDAGSNVCLSTGYKIIIAGALTNETPIGVMMYNPGVFTSGSTDSLKASDFKEKFASEDSAYSVVADGNELKLGTPHTHSFTYSATGATITATCSANGCPLPEVNGNHTATLTIAAPEHTNVGDNKSADATITDANSIKGEATVSYYAATKNGTTYTKTGSALGSAPTGAGNYVAEITVGGVTASVGYTIDKAAASVATPPTAKELTANGTAQELVNAGTAEGGTMRYVLGTNATTAPTTGWSADIPTGTEAGSYYMWYKAAGDADHSDSAAACVTVTVSAKKHSVTATLTTQTVAPVTLKLMQGKDNKATENVSVYTVSADTTVYTYSNTFSEVEDGVYNIVATQTIDGAERTVTSAVALTSADGDPTVNATMPDAKVNSVLEVKDGAPAAVVKGLDAEAVANAQTGSTVTYKMEVDDTTTANADAAKVNTEAQKTVPAGKTLTMTFMDITITKTTTPDGGSASTETVHQTNSVIETVFPYAWATDGYTVWMWRNHQDAVTKLTQLSSAPTTPSDGTYWVDKTNQLVHLFGSGYSVYAIGYVEGNNVQPVTTKTTTGGGGSSASSTITVPVSGDSGSVSVSAAVSGTTATLKAPTTAELNKVIGESVKTGAVVIDVSGLKKDIAAVSIPAETVKAIEKAVSDASNDAKSLTVKLSDGSVTFDAKALAAIVEQMKGSDLKLNLDSIAESRLNAAQSAAAKELSTQAVYDAYMTSNGVRISDFKGGSAIVSVPYELKDGQKAVGLTVWYLADDGGKTQMNGSYANGSESWPVDHFSNYVIAYDEARTAVCPKDATCPISAFTDADPKAWYHDGVHYVLEHGIMSGMGDGLFAPNGTTTRAQIATMIYRLAGSPQANGENVFADVAEGMWYTDAIRWTASAGVVTGFERDGKTVFDPDAAVTREQFAAMLYRYAKLNGQGFTGAWMFLLDYPDAADVSEWADEAMHWMVMQGVINGMDGKLVPQGSATRAQVATMLMRYCTEVAK